MHMTKNSDPLDELNKGVFSPDSCHSLTGYNCDYIPKNSADFEKHLDAKHGGR